MTAGAVSAPLIIPIMHLHTHRAKNHVDTHTPVSMHSDTPSSQIFFSLDGSKPEAEPRGGSRKYSGPLLLHAGKVTVRAMAVTSDGRRSSTVTKVFIVDQADPNRKSSEEDFLLSDLQRPSEGASAGSPLRPPEPRMMGSSPLAGPRFLIGRLGSPNRKQQTGPPPRPPAESSGGLSSTETSRIQRETDFLRCAQCLTLRPSDPFSRFCAQCGAALPGLPAQRPPPAEGGQVVSCVSCGSRVPVNTRSCLICETSVTQQPQASIKLQDHVMCVSCGCGNPAQVSRCLTCESRLQPAVCVGSSAPSGRMLSCSRCKRLNRSDARFCDWCGSKGHAVSCVLCWRCGASAPPNASYCPACSTFLQAPPPRTSRSDMTTPVGGAKAKQASAPTSHDATLQATPSKGPAPRKRMAPPTAECSTQTVGLYYPSATELQRKEQQREKRSKTNAERQPASAVSPGRGFWRQQVDHVCSHLRSYAQNNASFRTLLGEPRLGRMVSAVIQEDQHEVTVSVSFVSAGREPLQVDPAGDGDSLSSVTETSAHRGLMKPPKLNRTPKPPVLDVQLLEELGPGGGRVSAVQQLLDQGADPSCCHGDGRHALTVAVVNGHHDVLPVLVQRGADVDQQSGPKRTTALHEAAALGPEGLQSARVLLSCKASVGRRSSGGQTAYDAALRSGCRETVSLITAQTGDQLLRQLTEPGRLLNHRLNLDVS
ncbi:double zinc ribbon and ankyrin repeat-containing protein 1 [Trematomus bernacchii]|uniref:double zinc ribbon and ankyrin repeat-containing protein 1 n=1 Tax=Trematomus bernacchii TaxID=40690 RepID=UPI00146F63AA|nr:double zinc ribbon and ankyrin repeat-containing protein 1 [Trematomus bernacchii]